MKNKIIDIAIMAFLIVYAFFILPWLIWVMWTEKIPDLESNH